MKHFKYFVLSFLLFCLMGGIIVRAEPTSKPQIPIGDQGSFSLGSVLTQTYKKDGSENDIIILRYKNFKYYSEGLQYIGSIPGTVSPILKNGKPFYACDIELEYNGKITTWPFDGKSDFARKYCYSERIETVKFPKSIAVTLDSNNNVNYVYYSTMDDHSWKRDGDTTITESKYPYKGMLCVYEDVNVKGFTLKVQVGKDGIPSYYLNGRKLLTPTESYITDGKSSIKLVNPNFSWSDQLNCLPYANLNELFDNYSVEFSDKPLKFYKYTLKNTDVFDQQNPVQSIAAKLNTIVSLGNVSVKTGLASCLGDKLDNILNTDNFECNLLSDSAKGCLSAKKLSGYIDTLTKTNERLNQLTINGKTLEAYSNDNSYSTEMEEIIKLYRNAINENKMLGDRINSIINCVKTSSNLSQADKDTLNGASSSWNNTSQGIQNIVNRTDKKLNITFTPELKQGNCADFVTPEMQKIISKVYYFIIIIGMVSVAIFGMLDFVSAVMSDSSDAIQKAIKKFAIRLLALVILLLLPKLLSLVLKNFLGVADPFCGIF